LVLKVSFKKLFKFKISLNDGLFVGVCKWLKRKQEANRHPRLKDAKTRCYVLSKLMPGWPPEQIAGRMGMDCASLSISHEAIYQYIYDRDTEEREELIKLLRRGHRKRRTKGVIKKLGNQIDNSAGRVL